LVLAQRRRGGPRLRQEALHLVEMLDWLADALKEQFTVRHDVEPPQSGRPVRGPRRHRGRIGAATE
jgi:hypothetical protein